MSIGAQLQNLKLEYLKVKLVTYKTKDSEPQVGILQNDTVIDDGRDAIEEYAVRRQLACLRER